jgi:hypothetical protein
MGGHGQLRPPRGFENKNGSRESRDPLELTNLRITVRRAMEGRWRAAGMRWPSLAWESRAATNGRGEIGGEGV